MSWLYHNILYRPILNALIFIYQTISFQDLGVAIILLTILIRLILYPFFQKSLRHQTVMQAIQPEVKKIQEQHKKDPQKQGEALMALYKEKGINPFMGFGLLFIQLLVLIPLYQIFIKIFDPQSLAVVYSFITIPSELHAYSFFGLINLKNPSILIVLFAAAAQYFQMRLSLGSQNGPAQKMQQTMAVIAPIITVLIFARLPAAIAVYWLASTLISVGQQWQVNQSIHAQGTLGEVRQPTSRADGV